MEWVAYCTKVIGLIPEGDQKGHKYTSFARSALCTGNLYDLYALVIVIVIVIVIQCSEDAEIKTSLTYSLTH